MFGTLSSISACNARDDGICACVHPVQMQAFSDDQLFTDFCLVVMQCCVHEGAGESDHYLEKSLGHVSAWLHDTRTADAWNKGTISAAAVDDDEI